MRKIFIIILSSFLFVSNAPAQNWVSIPTGSLDFLTSCSYGSASHVYVVGSDMTILKSTNGGNSFASLSTSFLPSMSTLSGCAFTSSDTGVITGADINFNGFIYRTTNGGTSWTSVLSGAPDMISDVQFTSPLIGYAIAGTSVQGVIYKTLNGGITWNPIYTGAAGAEESFIHLHFLNDSTGKVSGFSGTFNPLSRMINVTGGSSTSIYTNPNYAIFIDIHFISNDTGFVTALDNSFAAHILRTTNGGGSWTSVYTNSSEEVYGITFLNSQKGYAVGTAGLILKTTNGGLTWSPTSSPASDDLYEISFRDTANAIIVGDFGTVLKLAVCTGSPTTGNISVGPSCNPITVNGQSYTSSGTYTQLLTNAVGCDSTLIINAIINSPSSTSINASTCSSYNLNGTVYTSTGSYVQTYTNSVGCDSIITLNLVVNNVNAVATQLGLTLTALPAGATYQWLTCPTFAIIPGATSQNYNATTNGSYAVKVTQGVCSDTSLCLVVNGVGIEEQILKDEISIFPNPSSGLFHIFSKEVISRATIRVSDVAGQILSTQRYSSSDRFTVDLRKFANGIYLVEVIDETKAKVYQLAKLAKQ